MQTIKESGEFMKKPIRILHVLQRMEAGGTQALLMNLYRNIDRSKVQFDFLVEYPNKYFYDDEIISLGGKVYYSNVRIDKNVFKFEKLLKRILKENDYSIIHMHTYSIGYFVLKTAKKCGVPIRIAHSHNNQTVKDKFYLLKLFMQKIYTKYATDLFACSEEAGRYLFKNKNFTVLNNSIDSQKFVFSENTRNKKREELKLTNEFLIGHIGRLHPQKNHSFLIKLFYEYKKSNNNSKLLLIGDGPLEDDIKELIKKYKIQDSVIMLKNRSDVNELLMAMDVFVLPSIFEGLGIVAIEAQAAGTPCVTSNKLPKESVVSPICVQLDLNDDINLWINEINKISKTKYAHKNMSKYIMDANYDIKSSSKFMEKYYLDKYKEI